MSRTIRRKSETWEFRGIDGWFNQIVYLDYGEVMRDRVRKEYHTDHYHSMRMVPAWFRRVLNRQRRAQQQHRLNRSLKSDIIYNEDNSSEWWFEYDPWMKRPKDVRWRWW